MASIIEGLSNKANGNIGYGLTRGNLVQMGIPVEAHGSLDDRTLQQLASKHHADVANMIAANRGYIDNGSTIDQAEADKWRQYRDDKGLSGIGVK